MEQDLSPVGRLRCAQVVEEGQAAGKRAQEKAAEVKTAHVGVWQGEDLPENLLVFFLRPELARRKQTRRKGVRVDGPVELLSRIGVYVCVR